MLPLKLGVNTMIISRLPTPIKLYDKDYGIKPGTSSTLSERSSLELYLLVASLCYKNKTSTIDNETTETVDLNYL